MAEQTICALCRLPLQGVPVDRCFCSQHCARLARRQRSELKACPFCGQIFARRPAEARANFAKQRCCSQKCAGKLMKTQQVAMGVKTCRGCRVEFGPRNGERPGQFRLRVFCTRDCANRTRDQHRPRVIWAEAV